MVKKSELIKDIDESVVTKTVRAKKLIKEVPAQPENKVVRVKKVKEAPAQPVEAPKKAKQEKPQVIIKEIHVPVKREKRKPTAYNQFISEQTKTNKMSFTDAVKAWKTRDNAPSKETQ